MKLCSMILRLLVVNLGRFAIDQQIERHWLVIFTRKTVQTSCSVSARGHGSTQTALRTVQFNSREHDPAVGEKIDFDCSH